LFGIREAVKYPLINDMGFIIPRKIAFSITECEHSQLKDCSNDEEGTNDESRQEATIASPERRLDGYKEDMTYCYAFRSPTERHVCRVSKNEWDG